MGRKKGSATVGGAKAKGAQPPAAAALEWNSKVACRTLEGTAFILLDSRMVRLNEVGTRIWELYETGSTIKTVVDQIVVEFEAGADRVERDANVFVGELLEKQMLVPVSAES